MESTRTSIAVGHENAQHADSKWPKDLCIQYLNVLGQKNQELPDTRLFGCGDTTAFGSKRYTVFVERALAYKIRHLNKDFLMRYESTGSSSS